MPRPTLALDADGVLLDYHSGYADAWQRAFGERPRERDPLAYWPSQRWHVEPLDDAGHAHFRGHFDEHFWSTMPSLDGAIAACHRLNDAGFDLICVSALGSEFEAARLHNLRQLGFPIERVIATGHVPGAQSPKAETINRMRPEAFVDDYLPYLRGVSGDIHTALVLRAPNGSPNDGDEMRLAKSTHQDLAAFADYWLTR